MFDVITHIQIDDVHGTKVIKSLHTFHKLIVLRNEVQSSWMWTSCKERAKDHEQQCGPTPLFYNGIVCRDDEDDVE